MIFTVGHSTHGADELASILSGIDVLMDIRSHPTSRWPQHTKPELERWVPAAGIEYRWEPRLGGWTAADVEDWGELMAGKGVDLAVYSRGAFPKQHISRKLAPRSVPTWTNRGLYDYSWFTALPSFLDALADVTEEFSGRTTSVALMCAEALWWQCHRSLVADVLWARDGVDALHLKPRRPVRPTTARWVAHSKYVDDRLPRYEGEIRSAWSGGGLSRQLVLL